MRHISFWGSGSNSCVMQGVSYTNFSIKMASCLSSSKSRACNFLTLKGAVAKWCTEYMIFLSLFNVFLLNFLWDGWANRNDLEKTSIRLRIAKICSSQPAPIRRWRMLRSSTGSCRPPQTERSKGTRTAVPGMAIS